MSEDSLEEKALELIKSRPNGVLQSDLWKDLDIDSRKCSRVISKLEADGKIVRTWETVKGTRTYRISYAPQKKETPKKVVDFSDILVNGHIAPCIGCTYECEPDYCPDLGNWIELLTRAPVRKAPAKVAPPVKEPEAPAVVEEPEPAPPVKAKKPAKAKAPAKAAPPEEKEEEKPAAKSRARKAHISSKSVAKPAPEKPAAKAPVKAPAKAKSAKKK